MKVLHLKHVKSNLIHFETGTKTETLPREEIELNGSFKTWSFFQCVVFVGLYYGSGVILFSLIVKN